MPRDRLLRVLAVLSLGIAVLHIGAIVFHLYWFFWWYDMFLHLLGGVFIALLVLWVRFFSGYIKKPAIFSVRRVFLFTLLGLLVIGIGWEVFERLLGPTWSVEGYWLDTGIDIALDIVGGVVGWFYFVKKYRV